MSCVFYIVGLIGLSGKVSLSKLTLDRWDKSSMRLMMTLYCRFEKHYGRKANGSFCVTKAMQHELAQNWGIK